MLNVRNLQAYYGKSHVLHGVDLNVQQGEIVSLLGRNGVGRSTTAKAIIGLVACSGEVLFKGQDLTKLPTYRIAHLGIGYVPENRDNFPTLTVEENLALGLKGRTATGWTYDDMYRLFPRLQDRRHTQAGVLSGGEQQMLTLARTMVGNPELKGRGTSILLIEQKLTIALEISQRVYVMGHGHMVFEGTPDDLRKNKLVRQEWLEV
jgi:branched-chain amino acid transport system ATP-binding protein